MAKVVRLQISPSKGEWLEAPGKVKFVSGLGIEGDHHTREGNDRQVLLHAEENCDAFGLSPGEAKENVTTRGIDLQALAPGTILEVGGAEIEITSDCAPCPFMDTLRPGLQEKTVGRRGMLAKVVRTGEVSSGDPIRVRDRGD